MFTDISIDYILFRILPENQHIFVKVSVPYFAVSMANRQTANFSDLKYHTLTIMFEERKMVTADILKIITVVSFKNKPC